MYHKMAFSGLILIKKFRQLKRVVKINILFERYTLWLMVVLFKGMEKRLKLYTHTHTHAYSIAIKILGGICVYLCANTI